MKNQLILFLMLTLSCASCDGPGFGVDVQDGTFIEFVDEEGNNILLKENPEFNAEDLRLYYYNKDNKYVMRYNGSAGNPYFIELDSAFVFVYGIIGDDDGKIISGNKYSTFLDFGNGDIDTLDASGQDKNGRRYVTDIWYNGKRVLDNGILVQPNNLPGVVFSVVK